MTKNITAFFATKNDLSLLLEQVASKRSLQYVLAGLFDSPEIRSSSVFSELDLGLNYLVADYEQSIEVRAVPQRGGGEKFAVDQLVNGKTVTLRPGGKIEKGCLIAGQIGTASEDPISLGIYKLFVSEIRRQFMKIKSYYVGPEAFCLLDDGVRLTASLKTPSAYDLKRE